MIVLLIILLYIMLIMLYFIHEKNKEILKCENSIKDLSQRIELTKESYDRLLCEKEKLSRMCLCKNRESKSYEYVVCLLCGDIYRSYDIKNVSSTHITQNGDYTLADSDGRMIFLANKEKIFFIARKNGID